MSGALPRSPTDRPAVRADLSLSGAVQAHVVQARWLECAAYNAGAIDFYRASILFEWNQTWYGLEAISQVPLQGNLTTGSSGYRGPGSYTATIRLRKLLLGGGGMITGDHVWITGYRHESAMTISDAPTQISIEAWDQEGLGLGGRFSSSTELWPSGEYAEPPMTPTPAPDQLVILSGSWQCAQ